MLKNGLRILFLIYLSAVFFLPNNLSSTIFNLPDMYFHCKTTEDKDMALFDFITDHLINIDCVFDSHNSGDEQKPHCPVQINHYQIQTIFIVQRIKASIIEPVICSNKVQYFYNKLYFFDYKPKIIRPPII